MGISFIGQRPLRRGSKPPPFPSAISFDFRDVPLMSGTSVGPSFPTLLFALFRLVSPGHYLQWVKEYKAQDRPNDFQPCFFFFLRERGSYGPLRDHFPYFWRPFSPSLTSGSDGPRPHVTVSGHFNFLLPTSSPEFDAFRTVVFFSRCSAISTDLVTAAVLNQQAGFPRTFDKPAGLFLQFPAKHFFPTWKLFSVRRCPLVSPPFVFGLTRHPPNDLSLKIWKDTPAGAERILLFYKIECTPQLLLCTLKQKTPSTSDHPDFPAETSFTDSAVSDRPPLGLSG